MPDLPGAVPHLTYGYATFSPVVIAEQLKAARAARAAAKAQALTTTEAKAVADRYAFTRDDLWHGTVFPATDADNWLAAGSAALLADPARPAGEGGRASRRPGAPARHPPEPAGLRDVAGAGRRGGAGRSRLRPLRAVPRPAGEGHVRPPPTAAPLRQQGLLRVHEGLPRAAPRAGRHDRAVPRGGPRGALARRCGGPAAVARPHGRPRARAGGEHLCPGEGVACRRAGRAAGRRLPPGHHRCGDGRREAVPLPDDARGTERRGDLHRPREAGARAVRRASRTSPRRPTDTTRSRASPRTSPRP